MSDAPSKDVMIFGLQRVGFEFLESTYPDLGRYIERFTFIISNNGSCFAAILSPLTVYQSRVKITVQPVAILFDKFIPTERLVQSQRKVNGTVCRSSQTKGDFFHCSKLHLNDTTVDIVPLNMTV